MRYPRFTISLESFILILAVYASLFLNQSLWGSLIASQSADTMTVWLFMVAMVIGVTALQFGILSLLIYRFIALPTAIVILLSAVSADFFAKKYGVFFDMSMVRNIVSTNSAEAGELFTLSLLVHFLIYGVPGVLLLSIFRIKPRSLIKGLALKLVMIVLSLIVTVVSFVSVFKNFSATMRNHTEIRHLVLPMSYLISTPRVLFESGVEAQEDLTPIGLDAKRQTKSGVKPTLLVLVVGETVRAANWGLSGYARQTTPNLAKQNFCLLYTSDAADD